MERATSEHVECSHTFLLGMTAYNVLYVCMYVCMYVGTYVLCCQFKTLSVTFTLHFGISTFQATKVFSLCISDVIIRRMHETVVFRNFQMSFQVSTAFMTKHLSEEKVLNILNDSDECVLSDSSENGSSDENGRAITAEEVHATCKEERYNCLLPTT